MPSDGDHALFSGPSTSDSEGAVTELGPCLQKWSLLWADQRQPRLLSLDTLYEQLLTSPDAWAATVTCVYVLHKIHS